MNVKSLIKRGLDPFTRGVFALPFVSRVFEYFAAQKQRRERRVIEARLRESGLYGDEVQFGPFKGMKYPPFRGMKYAEGWASCRFQKIIGSYEAELHDIIRRIMEDAGYSSIINAGSAEGYFAVGLGRATPDAKTYAYDMHLESREFLKRLAEINGIASGVEVAGRVSPEVLASLDPGARPLVVCDVDTYETTLLDPEAVPWLKEADILVEIHDNMEEGISEKIRNRFENTHDIEHVESAGLKYENYPILRELTFRELRLMVDEGRPGLQDWFFMTVKK